MAAASAIANVSECVAPRWPHGSPYSTPRAKPMTSVLGSSDKADHHAMEDHDGAGASRYTRAAAMPTAIWPMLAMNRVGWLDYLSHISMSGSRVTLISGTVGPLAMSYSSRSSSGRVSTSVMRSFALAHVIASMTNGPERCCRTDGVAAGAAPSKSHTAARTRRPCRLELAPLEARLAD